jgi:hypothetical protein
MGGGSSSLGDFGDQIKDSFGKLDKINDVTNSIKDAFEKIPKMFAALGVGLNDIFGGIGDEFNGVVDGVGDGFGDIITLIKYTFEFLFTYLMCGVKFMRNIHTCIFYYSLQAAGQIIYLPVRIMLWFLYAFIGFTSIYDTETYLWDEIEKVDTLCFTYLGFHFTHYPRNIRDDCYNCKRLKASALTNKANDIQYDFTEGISKKLTAGTDRIKRGADEILHIF